MYVPHAPVVLALRHVPWWPYAAAALGTAAITAPLMLAQHYLTIFNVSLLYLVPVLLSATLGGLGPGVVAAVVALFAFDWFFLSPRYTVTVTNPQDAVAFGVFLGAAAVTGQLAAVARRRARNVAVLHDLSATLNSSDNPADALPAVATHIATAFRLPHCTLTLLEPENVPAAPLAASTTSTHSVPFAASHVARRPSDGGLLSVPLRHGKGVGALYLDVGARQQLRADERHILEALVQAAAVTLERAQLASEERAAALARESDRLKSALLAAVSHELRTPLASIKATTSGLLEGDVSYDAEALRRFLGGIDSEADRLMRLGEMGGPHVYTTLLVGRRFNWGAIREGGMFPSNDALIRTLAQEHLETVRETLNREELALALPGSRSRRLARLRAWVFGRRAGAAISEAGSAPLGKTPYQGAAAPWQSGTEGRDGAYS